MDESVCEVANIFNAIAANEEKRKQLILNSSEKETNYHHHISELCKSHISEKLYQIMNEETSSDNSNVLEASPLQKNVENSNPVKVFFSPSEFSIREARRAENMSVMRDENMSVVTDKLVSFIRRKVRLQKALEREKSKLGMVWTKRGLPTDRDTLCSAAKKDAFDLTGLSQSLPSTSGPEVSKRSSVVECRRICSESCRVESLGGLAYRKHLLEIHRGRHASEDRRRSQGTKIVQSCCASEMKRVLACSMLARMKEASKEREGLTKRKSLQVVSLAGLKGFNFETDKNPVFNFAEMSLDDKQEEKGVEKQNSDVANNQQVVALDLSPKLHHDVGQCSSWDRRRSWMTDFEFRDTLRMPHNSPVKNDGNADKSNPTAFMEKYRAIIYDIQSLRKRNKLNVLNSRRGVLPEDMNGSESEEPSSAMESTSLKNFEVPKVRKRREYNCRSDSDWMANKRHVMKETVKNFRSFKSFYSLGSVKSDKVVAD